MNYLSDILTYIRRIIKSPSDAVISDALLIDYVNRFYIMDMDARLQVYDLKTKYQFLTTPGVDQYNMPLYDVQVETTGSETQSIASFPVYQGFMSPAKCNGIEMTFYTQRSNFYATWPAYVQSLPNVAVADGGPTYTVQLSYFPLLKGHVDITGIIATGQNVDPIVGNTLNLSVPTTSAIPAVYFSALDANNQNANVSDSGQFLSSNINYGLLMRPGSAPKGNIALSGGYSTSLNTINYASGTATFTFTDDTGSPLSIPSGNAISAQCYYYQQGLPRTLLYYNNIITVRPPPNRQYLIELDAYLSPAAFFSTEQAVPFGYMAEYIARGAARKILSDTGDTEQFNFYEPLFKEQETLVWKRSQRQFTSTKVQTIYSQQNYFGGNNQNYRGN